MNIFHCCPHKSGSQWIRAIFSDQRIKSLSGLAVCSPHDKLSKAERKQKSVGLAIDFDSEFPKDTIVTPLYINYPSFCAIPKIGEHKAFFVLRDPRDILVSWYFSVRYSHNPMGRIQEFRDEMNKLSLDDGLIFSMERLRRAEYFQGLLSWMAVPEAEKDVMIVKFEDLTSSKAYETFQSLFSHCGIDIPSETLEQILVDYSFANLSKRFQGEEDIKSHYRKGMSGDWVNYFNEDVSKAFDEVYGDLPQKLGYSSDREEILKNQVAENLFKLSKLGQQNIELKEQLVDKENWIQNESKLLREQFEDKQLWFRDVQNQLAEQLKSGQGDNQAIQRLNQELDQRLASINEKQAEINQLHQHLSSQSSRESLKEQKIKDLQLKLERKDEKISASKEKISALKEEKKSLRGQIKSLREQMKAMRIQSAPIQKDTPELVTIDTLSTIEVWNILLARVKRKIMG